jgi:hypothetical protein
MRERFLFKLAGIALVARTEAFADIMGDKSWATPKCLILSCELCTANSIVDQICP